MVESIVKHLYAPRQTTHKNLTADEKTFASPLLCLEEEEMEIRPWPFMRSYRLNETTEPQQQPPIEEKSTKENSSLTDQ